MTGRWILLAAVLLLGSGREVWAQNSRRPEYFVKAEYMAFVGQAAAPRGGSPQVNADGNFRLGIIGRSPFEGYFVQVAGKRTIQGRSLKILYPRTQEEALTCHMVFVCRSESDRIEEILGWVKGRPIITVGDTKGFLNRGIMVNFALDQDRIVIWLNAEAAKKVGVNFAPDFLALVKIYSGREGSGGW